MLHDFGVRYDAPSGLLHAFKFPEGPNHFDAPSDPYVGYYQKRGYLRNTAYQCACS